MPGDVTPDNNHNDDPNATNTVFLSGRGAPVDASLLFAHLSYVRDNMRINAMVDSHDSLEESDAPSMSGPG